MRSLATAPFAPVPQALLNRPTPGSGWVMWKGESIAVVAFGAFAAMTGCGETEPSTIRREDRVNGHLEGCGEACSDMGLAGIIAWFGSDGAGAVMGHAVVGGGFAGLDSATGPSHRRRPRGVRRQESPAIKQRAAAKPRAA